jgi:hypothetical protein
VTKDVTVLTNTTKDHALFTDINAREIHILLIDDASIRGIALLYPKKGQSKEREQRIGFNNHNN